MEFKGIKLNIIILVTVIVIGLFFSGQYLYKIYNIDKPVKDDILAINGVENVKLIDNNGQIDLDLTLQPGTDFFHSYKNIKNTMQEKLGQKSGEINIINDKNSASLEDIFYKLQFAIYEGINTGEFVQMEQNVDQLAAKYKLDNHNLWIDDNAIYLQLDKNNSSFYKKIPYNKTLTVKADGGENIG